MQIDSERQTSRMSVYRMDITGLELDQALGCCDRDNEYQVP